MSVIKYITTPTDSYVNFKINLDNKRDLLGLQQEIDSLTQVVSNVMINDVNDLEVEKYIYSPELSDTYFKFLFTQDGSSYDYKFTNAGFTIDEVNKNAKNFLGSFFIVDFYDTYDTDSQTKIFSAYLTLLGQEGKYLINSSAKSQLNYWYVPKSYITSLSGNSSTIYFKFSFFNAKTGQIVLFYNLENENSTLGDKLYFTGNLNLTNKYWNLTTTESLITAKQLWSSNDYIKRVNDTTTKFNNYKQSYPKGGTFDYNNRKYI